MDTLTLVDHRIDDGRRLINLLKQEGFPLTAVFWVETSEEGNWALYIASPAVDQEGKAAAYRAVFAVLTTISGTTISVSDVTVIGVDNPITQNVLKIQERCLDKGPIISRHPQLGFLAADELYIYPLGTGPEILTSQGQPIPGALTDFGPGDYLEIPYFKTDSPGSVETLPVPTVLRLKKKEVRTFEVLAGLQLIEGRHFATYATVSWVDDGVVGVDYRVEEIK